MNMETELRVKSASTDEQSRAWMVGLLTLAVGLMTFEEVSVFDLAPFIGKSFSLTPGELGSAAAAYFVMFALSSLTVSRLAEARNRRKHVLVALLLALAVLPALSASAGSATTLICARALMGAIEGPIIPISQSIVALWSPAAQRGRNVGIVGGVGNNLLGMLIAPILLVRVAEMFGWRLGFLVVLAPAVACAVAIAALVRDPPAQHSEESVRERTILAIVQHRNVWLCTILCALFVAYVGTILGFLPLFYTGVRQLSPERMSYLMGTLGASATFFGIALPIASDYVGRRTVMLLGAGLSILCPVTALWYSGPLAVAMLFLFLGWALSGTSGIFTGTIPAEAVPPNQVSTAMGVIFGVGVLVGGLGGPLIAGWLGNRWGLRAPLLMAIGCAAAAVIVSACLRESGRRAQSGVERFPSVG